MQATRYLIEAFLFIGKWYPLLSQECEGDNPCCSGYAWDEDSKSCKECPVGFYGINCGEKCPYPTFGKKCDGDCAGKCDKSTCNFVHGCPNSTVVTSQISTSTVLHSITHSTNTVDMFNQDETSDILTHPVLLTIYGLNAIICICLLVYVFTRIRKKCFNQQTYMKPFSKQTDGFKTDMYDEIDMRRCEENDNNASMPNPSNSNVHPGHVVLEYDDAANTTIYSEVNKIHQHHFESNYLDVCYGKDRNVK